MDKKGIWTFLAVTVLASYAIQALVIWMRPLAILIYLLLVVPVVAAWVAARVSGDASYPPVRLRGFRKGSVVRIALVVPLVFVVIYVITTILGFSRPDWRLGELMAKLPSPDELNWPPRLRPAYPVVFLGLTLGISAVLGPTLYALLALGNEYGWRGYLLPRLMPLGPWRAYIIAGLFWGATFAPWLGHGYAGTRLAVQILCVLALAIVLSALLGEIRRRSGNVVLSAVCLGCICCQATTLWRYFFPPGATVTFPWGGALGVVAIIVWAVVALFPGFVFGPLKPSNDTTPTTQQAQPEASE